MEVMARTTGLSLVSIEEDCVHVMLRQEVPVALSASEGGCRAARTRGTYAARTCSCPRSHTSCRFPPRCARGSPAGTEDRTQEHTLSMHLLPNTSRLSHAQLSPATVDISREVEYARLHAHGSLPLLVSVVRGRLRQHGRRQAALEGGRGLGAKGAGYALGQVSTGPSSLQMGLAASGGLLCCRSCPAAASSLYPMTPVPGSATHVRVELACGKAAVVDVPAGHPDSRQPLTLVGLQGPAGDALPAPELLEQLHAVAGCKGLVKFLAAVAAL